MPLEREFRHYVEHQDELVRQYHGRVIVLKGTEVLGDFPTMEEAFWWASERDLIGEVMIQKVEPGEENYTGTIYAGLFFHHA